MCPIVPMLTCGLLRSNFSFAIAALLLVNALFERSPEPLPLPRHPTGRLGDHLVGDRGGRLGIVRKMHSEVAAALRAAAQIGRVTEHLRERHLHADDVTSRAGLGTLNLRPARV